jgi:undecaprenyl-diphosphatase
LDADVAERLVASRTAARNDLAEWGSFVASTPVKIGLTALVAIVALVAFKRWHETVFVALTLVFEATVFIVVTFVVARPRPDVVRLQDSPVTSSFPSGHVAAATVYGAFVIVVAWHTRSAWKRAGSAAAVAAIVVLVGWSRAYQGMHHLSDVVMGVVLGVWSLVLCRLVMGAPPHGQRIRRFTPVRVRHGR